MVEHQPALYVAPDGVGVVVGEYDPLREVQYDMWWRTVVAGPARNTAGVLGNDFPGAYFHHPAGVEHLLFLDADVDWRHTAAELRVRDRQLVLGFWPTASASGSTETASAHAFRPEALRAETRPAASPPTRWEGLTRLVTWCGQFLPPAPSPDEVPSYDERAWTAYQESLREDTALFTVDGSVGHRMYVAGTSDAWGDDDVDHLELLCQSDVALGLANLDPADRDDAQDAWLAHLTGLIGRFYSPSLGCFSNVFPLHETALAGGNVVVGRTGGRESTNVWYHLYTHARLAEIALSTPVSWERQLREAVTRTRWLARANRYLFPLLWWLDTGEECSAATEPAAGGAYAWLMIRAWDRWREDWMLEEAAEALEVLHRLPPDGVYGAGVLLPRAAWAAHALAKRTGEPRWHCYRDDFTAAALRMLYWRGELAGMFQACAAMRYPAMFENVANLLALEPFADSSPYPLRQVIGLQLVANQRFFAGLPAGDGVPWENLPTTEYPFAGQVGREIYAVGEVLQLPYLARRHTAQQMSVVRG